VVGIGNADGTGGTPSYAGGAITGVNKSITAHDQYDGTSEQLTGLLATDADIQSGDSGGPLVNMAGEVVGMDAAATLNGRFTGFGDNTSGVSRGYAIPIVTAVAIARQIEAGQSSASVHVGPTAQLGVYISGRATAANGVFVEQVQGGGPAAKSGIAEGDLITSVDGTSVTSPNTLESVMTTLSPNQKVAVTYETSQGDSHTTTVTLSEGPPQ
jgi:S1-C subfamily serine protease